jgi:hypothetical protein
VLVSNALRDQFARTLKADEASLSESNALQQDKSRG